MKMNISVKAWKILFIVCLALIVAMFAFPPWETNVNLPSVRFKEHTGYYFILSSPKPKLNEGRPQELIEVATISIDGKRLLAQAVPIFLLFAVSSYRLRMKAANTPIESAPAKKPQPEPLKMTQQEEERKLL